MNVAKSFIVTITLILFITVHAKAETRIVATVNGEHILERDVRDRLSWKSLKNPTLVDALKKLTKSPKTKKRLILLIKKAEPKTKQELRALMYAFHSKLRMEIISSVNPEIRKEALEELINEMVILQEAKRLNQTVSDKEVAKYMQKLLNNKNGKPEQAHNFFIRLMRTGVSTKTYIKRLKATLSLPKILTKEILPKIKTSSKNMKDVKESIIRELRKRASVKYGS